MCLNNVSGVCVPCVVCTSAHPSVTTRVLLTAQPGCLTAVLKGTKDPCFRERDLLAKPWKITCDSLGVEGACESDILSHILVLLGSQFIKKFNDNPPNCSFMTLLLLLTSRQFEVLF